MDRLLSMAVFVEVVKVGSFVNAANKFNLTPAMIGRHIKHLEKRVGMSLLNRSTRRQALTEVGKEYFAQCQKILDDFEALEQKALSIKNAPEGVLRVNAPVTLGSLIISSLLCDFLERYQDLDVHLELTDKKIDALHDDFDVIIRVGELADASYISRKIADYKMVYCVSPDYLNTYGIPASIDELKEHQLLGFTHWRVPPKKLNTVEINTGRFDSNSGMALKKAALKSKGVLLQPRILVTEELASGELIEILPSYVPKPKPINLIYKSRKNQPLKTKLFIDFIASKISL